MLSDSNKSNNYPDFPDSQKYLLLPGEAGNIELLIAPSKSISHKERVAIICHPHPLHEGTMDNKVVYTIHKAFHNFGCSTIRFNFRGVGKTDGLHDDGVGETTDVLTIIQWVKTNKPNCEIILAGFSFGAFISLKASKSVDCRLLISIAPVIHHQEYTAQMPITCPWLVIIAEQDHIIAANLLEDWLDKLVNKPDVLKFAEAGHFFHGNLPELKENVSNYLNTIF